MDSQDNQEKEYVLYQEAYDSILCEMCGTGYQSNALQALRMCERYDDLEPVAHAHWEEVNYYSHCGMKCSRCKARISYRDFNGGNHKFCHKCGAIMDEVVVKQ